MSSRNQPGWQRSAVTGQWHFMPVGQQMSLCGIYARDDGFLRDTPAMLYNCPYCRKRSGDQFNVSAAERIFPWVELSCGSVKDLIDELQDFVEQSATSSDFMIECRYQAANRFEIDVPGFGGDNA